MRKCDEHQTLVLLDVHVCPVSVCVCVHEATVVEVFHLSGQVKGLLLS